MNYEKLDSIVPPRSQQQTDRQTSVWSRKCPTLVRMKGTFGFATKPGLMFHYALARPDRLKAKPCSSGEQLGEVDTFSHLSSRILSVGCISHTEEPSGIHWFETSVASASHPVIDQVPSMRKGSESDIVLRLPNSRWEQNTYKDFWRLNTAVFVVSVSNSEVRCKVLGPRVQSLE